MNRVGSFFTTNIGESDIFIEKLNITNGSIITGNQVTDCYRRILFLKLKFLGWN